MQSFAIILKIIAINAVIFCFGIYCAYTWSDDLLTKKTDRFDIGRC